MQRMLWASVALSISPSLAGGQSTCTQLAELVGSDTGAGDLLGLRRLSEPLAVDGSSLVLGFPANSTFGSHAGCAYVFEDDGGGWRQVAQLFASNAVAHQGFGSTAAIEGDLIVVGAANARVPSASGALVSSGAVYVFERDVPTPGAWGQTAIIAPPVPYGGERFGEAVALSGDVLVVGSPAAHDSGQPRKGAVHVFRRASGGAWIHEAELRDPQGLSYDRYGSAVAVDGSRLVAASHIAHVGGLSQVGAADVFALGSAGWAHEADLAPAGLVRQGLYGYTLSIEGTTVAIGAPAHASASGVRGGSVFLFERSGGSWSQLAHLSPGDLEPSDFFGHSAHLDDERLVVGSPMDGDPSRRGSAYLFGRDPALGTFVELEKLRASDGARDDLFGRLVAMSGDTIAVSAPRSDEVGGDSGSIYVFDCPPPATSPLDGDYHLAGLELSLYGHSGGGVAIVMDTGEIAFDGSSGVISSGLVSFDRARMMDLVGVPTLEEQLLSFSVGGTYTVDPDYELSLQMGPESHAGVVAEPPPSILRTDAFLLRFAHGGSGHALRGLVVGGAKSTAFDAARLEGRYRFALLMPVLQPDLEGWSEPEISVAGVGSLAGESLRFTPQGANLGLVEVALRPRGAVLDLASSEVDTMPAPPAPFGIVGDYFTVPDGRVLIETPSQGGTDEFFGGFATPDGELLVLVQRQNVDEVDAAGNPTKGKREILLGVAQPDTAPADPESLLDGTFAVYGLGLGLFGATSGSGGGVTSSILLGELTFDGQGSVSSLAMSVDRATLDLTDQELELPGPFSAAGSAAYSADFDPASGVEVTIDLPSGSTLHGSVSATGRFLVLEMHGEDGGAQSYVTLIGMRVGS
ncbi:MAG: hypothetical protein GY711_19010 [bacterium]|nr:hypothetical protein [bacterium]